MSTGPDNPLKKLPLVYPNMDQLYEPVPWYFNVTQNSTTFIDVRKGEEISDITLPVVNVEVLNFFGIAVSNRILNGMWFDFTVVQMMYFFLNGFNLWLIVRPIKIVNSKKTEELLEQYRILKNNTHLTNK